MDMEGLPSAIGTPQGNGLEGDFARWLEEGNDLLARFYHDMRGEELDETAQDIHWKKVGDQLINEIGARKIIAFLRPLLSKNTFVSETGETDAAKLKLALTNQIAKDLFNNSRRYNIEPAAITHITIMSYPFINFSINRALGGAEKELLKQTQSEQRSHMPMDQDGIGGALSKRIGRMI